MNINNTANVAIDHMIWFFNRLDLLMFTKVNKKFNEYTSKYTPKQIRKKNKFMLALTLSLKRDIRLCTDAAHGGYFDVLMYLREIKCNWDTNTCFYATYNGSLEIIKWLIDNGCKYNNTMCDGAIINGHLEILKMVKNNKCVLNFDFGPRCCVLAIKHNRLEILKWLLDNGCEYHEDWYVHEARGKNRISILEWMKKKHKIMNNGIIKNSFFTSLYWID
jgi:hypothetical protein